MSQAEQLLSKMITRSVALDDDEHIVIGEDRMIRVPEVLQKIAVQHDHNIETVTFDCPRYWDGIDLSEMVIYINYIRSDDEPGADLATNIVVDEHDDTLMHFSWTIGAHLTAVAGSIVILVCIKKVGEDGSEQNHWNSELNTELYVSPGMECEANAIEHYPGIITSLLTRMEYVEEIATPETMKDYVKEYLDKNPETPDTIKKYLYAYMEENYTKTEDGLQYYVDTYFETHPHLFVMSPTKPGVSCLWFNTGDGSTIPPTTVKLTAEHENDAVYAEVEDTVVPGYNFDIT